MVMSVDHAVACGLSARSYLAGQKIMAKAADVQARSEAAQPAQKASWAQYWPWISASAGHQQQQANLVLSDEATWKGQFPLKSGGVVVFTLCPSQPFSIAILPAALANKGGTHTALVQLY